MFGSYFFRFFTWLKKYTQTSDDVGACIRHLEFSKYFEVMYQIFIRSKVELDKKLRRLSFFTPTYRLPHQKECKSNSYFSNKIGAFSSLSRAFASLPHVQRQSTVLLYSSKRCLYVSKICPPQSLSMTRVERLVSFQSSNLSQHLFAINQMQRSRFSNPYVYFFSWSIPYHRCPSTTDSCHPTFRHFGQQTVRLHSRNRSSPVEHDIRFPNIACNALILPRTTLTSMPLFDTWLVVRNYKIKSFNFRVLQSNCRFTVDFQNKIQNDYWKPPPVLF